MERFGVLVLGVGFCSALASALSGCGETAPVEDVGMIQVALLQVPTDVRCIRLTVDQEGRRLTQQSSVSPGAASFTGKFGGLPLGPVELWADAFSVSCSNVSATTVATWVSAPLPLTLISGSPVSAMLQMRKPGQVGVSIDFACTLCYPDADGDGFGDKWATPNTDFCTCPAGMVANNLDCLDSDAEVNPNADGKVTKYVPDIRDSSPDGWDWNCNDVEEPQILPPFSGPGGCVTTGQAACASGCPQTTKTFNVSIPCGASLGFQACANAGCGITGAPGCMTVNVGPTQVCR